MYSNNNPKNVWRVDDAMKALKNIFDQYRAQILYLIFGGLTTLVNIILYGGLRWLAMPVMVAYVIAWFLTVLFAYVTNRQWVFTSAAQGSQEVLLEMGRFYVARLVTGLLGMAILWIGASLLHQNDMIWNIIQNIFVVITNYVLSKVVVFKAKEKLER